MTSSSSFVPPPPPPAGPPPSPPWTGGASSSLSREQIQEKVRWPAICLIATAGIGAASQVVGILLQLFQIGAGAGADLGGLDQIEGAEVLRTIMSGTAGIVFGVIGIGIAALIIYAALQMMQLRSWGLSLAGAIVAMIPCISPCCCLGLPFGIWALVVLLDDEVRSAFS